MHGLATHDARRLNLDSALNAADDVALAVDGHTQCVDHAAKHGVAYRHRQDAAGCLHRLTLFDCVGVAENNGADRVLVEVEG